MAPRAFVERATKCCTYTKDQNSTMKPTPSARAFKAALQPDTGFQAVLAVGNAKRMCSFRRPGCSEKPVQGHLKWVIEKDGNVVQWQRWRDCVCLSCRRYDGLSKKGKPFKVVCGQRDPEEGCTEVDHKDALYMNYFFAMVQAQQSGDWTAISEMPLHLLDPPRRYVPGVGVVLFEEKGILFTEQFKFDARAVS